MTTNPEILDPTETDRSEVIIDPETITQWVDDTLPTPHKASVDSLAEKFPSLKKYGEDSLLIQKLIQETFHADIQAPAHIEGKVLAAIKKDTVSEAPSPQAKEDIPAPASHYSIDEEVAFPTASLEPFVLKFPEARKKIPMYLWPAAALLFLMAIVGSVIHSEYHANDKTATTEQNAQKKGQSSVARDRKARNMGVSDDDIHSPHPTSTEQLTNYDLTRDQPSETDDKGKDKDDPSGKEAGKEEEKPTSP